MNCTFSFKTTLKTLCLIAFLGMSSLDVSAEDLLKKEYTVGPGDVLVIQHICRTLKSKALQRLEKDIQIKMSSFGKQEGIIGVATLALYHYYNKRQSKEVR